MPVLPEVGSIRVSPGLISPRASAWRTIAIAGRSFTEPAGLLPSSFTSTALRSESGRRCSRTSGVLPIKSSMVRFIAMPASSPSLGAPQLAHVRGDAVLDALELAAVARRAQPRQVGLGEALVALPEALRARDVLDEAAQAQLAQQRAGGGLGAAARRSDRHAPAHQRGEAVGDGSPAIED